MRLRTNAFRAHHPRWAWAPESGEGARLHGGRFNRPGQPALTTSLRPETAWLEAQQGFAFKAQPMTVCAYRVDCEDVLDLRDGAVLAAEGIAPGDLACAWEDLADRGERVPSWDLADRLRAAGAAAIIVPSFARGAGPRDANLVFWRWSRGAPHRLQVVDDHGRLPRDDGARSGSPQGMNGAPRRLRGAQPAETPNARTRAPALEPTATAPQLMGHGGSPFGIERNPPCR